MQPTCESDLEDIASSKSRNMSESEAMSPWDTMLLPEAQAVNEQHRPANHTLARMGAGSPRPAPFELLSYDH